MKNQNTFYILPVLLMSAFLASCNEDSQKADINESTYQEETSSGKVVNGLCHQDRYAPSPDNIIRKIDLLFVIDTSSSFKAEKNSVAEGFNSFVTAMPENTDYRVGVILAHSPKSKKSGILYQKNDEPLILDSEIHPLEEIQEHLAHKLTAPANDVASDGGEMGILSLTKAFEDNVETMKGQGFLRDEAALVVVFIADEKDVCAIPPEGAKVSVDKSGKENSGYAKYCVDENGNSLYTTQRLMSAVSNVKGDRPIVYGGVLYNNEATMPVKGENEFGYGYLEIVSEAGGIVIDLANGDYSNGLGRLARVAQVAVNPENEFQLDTDNVDLNSIEVLVDNQAVEYEYISELNQIKLLEERDPFSVAQINYCQKEEAPKIVHRLIAGGYHTCAMMVEGGVKCWGDNTHGQLGYGNTESIGDNENLSNLPRLNLGEEVIDMSAGFYHTCAVLESGSVKCWGENTKGQLGLGHTDTVGDDENASEFVAVPLGQKALKVYSGTRYNCALLEDRSVKCWGDNGFGQLGYGHRNNLGDDESVDSYGTVPLSNAVVQMDISTISFHTCAVLQNGKLKCWGLNNFGQLGYGHKNNLGDDETVDSYGYVPFSKNILQLATGFQHTCALVGGQQVQCWGNNSKGQIALGTNDIIGDDESADSSPEIITGGVTEHLLVSTGHIHSCSVGINNKAYCWGYGARGSLGLGHSDNIGDDESITGQSELQLPELINQIASGFYHSCALTKDEGEVICWGDNSKGQLGLGHTDNIGDDETPSEFSIISEEEPSEQVASN